MPSPFVTFLAQEPAPGAPQPQAQKPAAAQREFTLLEGPTTIFRHEYPEPPIVAIPILIACLAFASIVVERISAWLMRRLTSRTKTTVDDAFVAGFPPIVRTVLVFIGLLVVVQALVHEPERLVIWTRVVRATGIVFVGIAITRSALRMVDAWVHDKPQMAPVGPGIKLALKVLVIPVLLVTVLQVFEVEIAAFLTVLGVGSLAVALALQDILKNIFAGIQIVLDQPVRAGDFIALDDGRVRGVVLEVGLRSTKLRTVDNNVVIIPNNSLANAVITNMDAADPSYVHTLTLGVAYGSDSRKVQELLLDETARAVAEVEGFVQEPPRVAFTGFGDSSLNFSVIVRLARFSARLDASTELHHRLLARLNAAGIQIPFQTRTVFLRQEGAAPRT